MDWARRDCARARATQGRAGQGKAGRIGLVKFISLISLVEM